MPRASLTAVFVEKLRPPRAGQVEHYDRRLPGFGLRISYKGSKSWFLMTRVEGRLVRFTLGKYPTMSLADARDHARAAVRMVAEGKDPRRATADAKAERRQERLNTFCACAAEFLERYAAARLRPSTRREYRRILTGADTRAWRDRPVSKITKRDVLDVLDQMTTRGSPGAAKRALAYIRKFFNWCAERDLISTVPTDRIRPPHSEIRRDRVLSEEEVRHLLMAIANHESLFSPLILVLLLTGQRRAEVSGMRWSEIQDFGNDRARWDIPGSRTKNKHAHVVPLSLAVQNVLSLVPRVTDLVFTTTDETPVSGFGRAKRRLDVRIAEIRAAAGLPAILPWTLHDLRRTVVTMMNERLAVQPHVVEAVVNHIGGPAKAGVAGVYNRALYLEERRAALEKWALLVEGLTPST